MDKKFCIECRYELPITAKFCESCGIELPGSESPSESKPINQTPKETTGKIPKTSESKSELNLLVIIKKYFNGNFPLVKSFWMIALPINFITGIIGNIFPYAIFVGIPITIFILIGLWRSADNYIKKKKENKFWGYFVKVQIVLTIIFLFLSFFYGIILGLQEESEDQTSSTQTYTPPVERKEKNILQQIFTSNQSAIKIGTLLDKTGDLGSYGPPMEVGADLAIQLLQDAGVDIVLVPGDSGTANQKSIAEATRLIDIEGVDAIVGSLSSGVTMATAIAVTIPKNIPLMSPASTSPAISTMDDNDTVFRSTLSDAAQGVVLAQLAWDQGIRSAGAIYINNIYGEGLAIMFSNEFTRLGGTITALVPSEPGQTSYLSEVKKATAGNPDVLLAMTYPVTAQIYIREAIEGGHANKFMFVDGTKAQDMFDAMTKEHGTNFFDGMYGTAPGAPGSRAKSKFEELYKAANNGEMPTDPFIAETFDATMLLGLAAVAAQEGSACDSIKSCLRRIANDNGDADPEIEPGDIKLAISLLEKGDDINYEGAAGSQEIDKNGDVNNTIEIWTIKDGRITSTGQFLYPNQTYTYTPLTNVYTQKTSDKAQVQPVKPTVGASAVSKAQVQPVKSGIQDSSGSLLFHGLYYENARVKRVIDGDTVELMDGRKIRYLGVDAPEKGECYYNESLKMNQDSLFGGSSGYIRLYKGKEDKDSFGRYLRYVVIYRNFDLKNVPQHSDRFINDYLIQFGYGINRQDYESQQLEDIYYIFVNSENYASLNRLGLWGACR